MSDIYLHKGDFLEIIRSLKSNPSPSKGELNLHISSFASLLFSDFDLNSFKNLSNIIKNSDYDILKLYYSLACIYCRDKFPNLKLVDEVNRIEFDERVYKKLIDEIFLFIDKPKKDSLDNIDKLSISEDINFLSKDLMFHLSTIDINTTFDLFPELVNDVFEYKDDILYLKNIDTYQSIINDRGSFIIFFISKYYHKFSDNDLFACIKLLIDNKKFNILLLHLFIRLSFSYSYNFHSVLNYINNFFVFLPKHSYYGISQYSNLLSFLNSQFDPLLDWYEPLLSNNNKDIDYLLEDHSKILSHVNYQINSRFYLDTIFEASNFRKNNMKYYSATNHSSPINIIGGIHSLSWANIGNEYFSTKLHFNYNDYTETDKNYFFNNDSLNKRLDNNPIANIILLDPSHFNDNDILSLFDNFISDISNIINSKNLYLVTLPTIKKNSFNNSLSFEFYTKKAKEINDIIMNKQAKFGYNIINVDNYIKDNGLKISNSLLNSYILKPDIIFSIVESIILTNE